MFHKEALTLSTDKSYSLFSLYILGLYIYSCLRSNLPPTEHHQSHLHFLCMNKIKDNLERPPARSIARNASSSISQPLLCKQILAYMAGTSVER